VSLEPSNCIFQNGIDLNSLFRRYLIDFAEILSSGFPLEIKKGTSFFIQLANSTNSSYSSTCGPLEHQGLNLYELSVETVSFPCAIYSATQIVFEWKKASTKSVFESDKGTVRTYDAPMFVGDEFLLAASQPFDDVSVDSDSLHVYYVVSSLLPDGLMLNAGTGQVSGVFLAPLNKTAFNISLYDPITQQSKVVLEVKDLEVFAPLEVVAQVDSSSTLSPAAYAVPIGAALIILLIVYLYFRQDRKKEYHIFISYRGLAEL
jgi:hypothetical protein